jgi:hypothetical protein
LLPHGCATLADPASASELRRQPLLSGCSRVRVGVGVFTSAKQLPDAVSEVALDGLQLAGADEDASKHKPEANETEDLTDNDAKQRQEAHHDGSDRQSNPTASTGLDRDATRLMDEARIVFGELLLNLGEDSPFLLGETQEASSTR